MEKIDSQVSDQAIDAGDPMLERGAVRSVRFFDPYLETSNPIVQTYVAAVLAEASRLFPRKERARRPADQQVLERLVAAVYANLAAVVASGVEPQTVAVRLAKATKKLGQYGHRDVGQLPMVIEAMAAAGHLILTISRKKRTASSIAPTPAFVEALAGNGIGWHEFRQREGAQTIYLSKTERDFAARTRVTTHFEYDDTAEIVRFRKEMEEINARLRNADISFMPDGDIQPKTHERRLRRIFNLAPAPTDKPDLFASGGRLYDGWWESLPKLRRRNIRIEGSPIADLDYSSMFLRLAYARAGIPQPQGDLYVGIIPGDHDDKYREGVKQVVNAMLSRSTPMTKLPVDANQFLPEWCNGRMMSEAVHRRHAAVSHLFETGIGLNLMRTESDILVIVILELGRAGVIALPMHDGLMVHPRHVALSERVMGDISERLTGYRLPVKVTLSI